MKKFLNSKIFIGLICFFLGFLANHLLTRLTHQWNEEIQGNAGRFPVNPDDFDHDKLIDAARKMEQQIKEQNGIQLPELAGIEKREDDKFVYYDIPLSANEKKDHELKVDVNNGIISIKEHSGNTESMREFSIDPGLDESKATVINLDDRISIKIPKLSKSK